MCRFHVIVWDYLSNVHRINKLLQCDVCTKEQESLVNANVKCATAVPI